MSAVLDALSRRASSTPDDVVIQWAEGSLTTAELLAQVGQLATALADDRSPVGVLLDNGPAWVVVDLALILAQRPSVPSVSTGNSGTGSPSTSAPQALTAIGTPLRSAL